MKLPLHLSIDIETLSTRPTAAVISIGAVTFDLSGGIYDKFEVQLDSRFTPGDQDADTINWWKNQNPEVVKKQFGGKTTTIEALALLDEWVESCYHSIYGGQVWAGPASFDFPILSNLYAHYDRKTPWPWQAQKCVSTLCWQAKLLGVDLRSARIGRTLHDPLSDAIEQAVEVQLFVKAVNQKLWSDLTGEKHLLI